MPMQHQGSGGSRFTFPLQTRQRAAGAGQDKASDVLFQQVNNWFTYYEDFLYDAFDADEIGLSVYDASVSGTPTVGLVADGLGGQLQIQLASTSEGETAGIAQGNNLYIGGGKQFYFETRVQVVHTMAANQVIVIGLGSDIDSDLDAMTRNLWFRLDANFNLLVESDDNTTNQDDKDTGFDVVEDTWYILSIERGTDGKVYFGVADGNGENFKSFTMTDHFSGSEPSFGSNNLQPIILVQKASGTTQPELLVDYVYYTGSRN